MNIYYDIHSLTFPDFVLRIKLLKHVITKSLKNLDWKQ